VVDDDSDIRLLYANALARPSCHVDTAADGTTGWEALQANHYNLLITEYSLPGLTGVDLVRKLRAARMDLPVVIAAVRLPTRDLVLDPSLQLAAVLPKPFYISQLLETVSVLLRATDSPREAIPPLPAWRNWPLADSLRSC
jgi:DNA-binding response OmpR family regulator